MIRLLSVSLQNQIAAGEVVERPASVVKELVENALDADATDISVFIEEGGMKEIRIQDNGKGMNEADATLCFERYATSKISTADDLFALASFGFRGEALAAIASVSECSLKTAQKDSPHGWEVMANKTVKPVACAVGTEIIVKNLFHTVPARKKFIKSVETESREILKIMEQFALSHPHVSFHLFNGQKSVFSVLAHTSNNSFLLRCKKVLGENLASDLLPVLYLGQDIKGEGFCSHPSCHRSAKDKQFFFVNGRMIAKDALFSAAITQAYQSLLPAGRHPSVIFSLTLPPDMVDVNVHPRKLEVKFSNPSHIFQIIKGALETALLNPLSGNKTPVCLPSFSSSPASSSPASLSLSSLASSSSSHFAEQRFAPVFSKPSARFSSENMAKAISFFGDETSASNPSYSWKIIGQVRQSFIVVEEPNGICIIDQHAAHERVRYEQYMQALDNKAIEMQPLLTPVLLTFSLSEKQHLLDNKTDLEALGFILEDFEGNELAVLAVPRGYEHIDFQKLFSALLADLDFFDPSFGRELKKMAERLVSYAACRGAKKFGHAMSMEEMYALVSDWKACKNPQACAHGRPVSVFYSFSELENECGRY